jgi:hypothetical protein
MAKNKIEIVVLGKKIPVTIEEIEISELRYWVENPRVNSAIKRKYGDKRVTDKEIDDLLRQAEHVKELVQEIKKHGGLIDEVVVKGNTVLEGNSRLCAYRLLHAAAVKVKDEEGMVRWSYIKCRLLPDETTSEEIFTILGTWHIRGKKQWDTFEKAAYLKRMQGDHNYTDERIAEIIGESETFVRNTIEAHDLMIEHSIYEPEKYSYFIEMVKNKTINKEQEKDTQTRSRIVKAIKNGQFKRAEEMRDVPNILKDKVAKRAFFESKETVETALDIARDRHPELDGTFYNGLKKTSTKLSKVAAKQLEKIKEEIQTDTNKKDIVRRFQREVKKFCKHVGIE